MNLSVVVPTYRRPDLLERCLAALAAQAGAPPFEVVVVDDGSGDATTTVLRSWESRLAGLRWFSQPANAGPAAARNRAIRAATGELVLFLDDDVEAAPDLVTTHLRLHADASGDPSLGVLGRVDWAPDLDVTPFMRWLDRSGLQFAYETWLREGPIDPPHAAFYTANLSMHRALLDEVGGFDERFPYPAWEDMELAWRLHREAGFRLEYRPAARAFHTRAIDLPTFRRRTAMAAESAELLRTVQPDFPVGGPMRGRRPSWRRLVLRARALTGDESRLARWYAAEIAEADAEGRRRAATAAPSAAGAPAPRR